MTKTNLLTHVVFRRKRKAICALLFLFSVCSYSLAQETVISSGGNILGSGGTVSYSVGQITPNIITGAGGSAIQGIQFYFEAQTLSVIDVETSLSISAFPNPTSSLLSVRMQEGNNSEYSYKLFNLTGELILHGKMTGVTTEINIENLDVAIYLLKVSTNKKHIKTFKIIKK